MEEKKLIKSLVNLIQQIKINDATQVLGIDINDEKFNRVDVSLIQNKMNFITHLNFKFKAINPPGYIFTVEIYVNDFSTQEGLERLIKKQILIVNKNITDAIRTAAQIEMFV